MLNEIKTFVENTLTDEVCKELPYHNLIHTQNVVSMSFQLATEEKVPEEDLELVLISAWFHDVGYITNPDQHEKISCQIAEDFLKERQYPTNKIEVIKSVIMATEVQSAPSTLLEKIIRDADCSNLGSKKYNKFADLLKKEWELRDEKSIKQSEWNKINIDFIQKHFYYTDSANKLLNKQKEKNLNYLLKMEEKETTKSKKAKNTSADAAKGRETAYRVALRNHINLSKIADNKANIMLSVNALILSYLLGSNFMNNEESILNVLPMLILMVTSVLAIIFATLSTRPKVTHGQMSKEEILNKQGNLLFFGNFHAMDLKTYEWGMNELMKDPEYLYNSMNRDLFFLGKVLNMKYKWLSATYLTFVIGMIISTVSVLVLTFQS